LILTWVSDMGRLGGGCPSILPTIVSARCIARSLVDRVQRWSTGDCGRGNVVDVDADDGQVARYVASALPGSADDGEGNVVVVGADPGHGWFCFPPGPDGVSSPVWGEWHGQHVRRRQANIRAGAANILEASLRDGDDARDVGPRVAQVAVTGVGQVLDLQQTRPLPGDVQRVRPAAAADEGDRRLHAGCWKLWVSIWSSSSKVTTAAGVMAFDTSDSGRTAE
jgi:hypothetical protein